MAISYQGLVLVKYLGVIIDDELKWTAHVDNLYNKLIEYTRGMATLPKVTRSY